MALPKSSEIISRATTNFNNIKSALEFIGIDTSTITSDNYSDKIRALADEIDKVISLENQVTEDNSNFSNIYDAIVEKGQTPTESDRSTYADSILAIETSGGTEDYEINNCYHLFGVGTDASAKFRSDLIDIWLPHCKNVTNWNNAFEGTKIPDGKTIEIDMTSITGQDYTYAFLECMPESNTAEITLKAKTNGFFRYLFNKCNNTNKYGLINAIIEDISDGTGITTLSNLFQNARNIKSIDIDADLSNVQHLNYTSQYFNNTNKSGMLTVLDLSNLNIDWTKILNMQFMFNTSSYLTEIILASEVPVLTDVNPYVAFNGCTSLKRVGICFKDTSSKNTYQLYSDLFNGCTSLQEVYSTEDWILRAPIYRLFYKCSALKTLPAIHLDNWSLSSNSTYSYQQAFYGCSELEEITLYLDQIPPSNGYLINLTGLFYNCSKLKAVKGAFDLNNIHYNSTNVFYGCTALETIETSKRICNNTSYDFTLDLSASPVFKIADYITSLGENTSEKTRTIKLHADVYNALTDEIVALATTKNYTLASA